MNDLPDTIRVVVVDDLEETRNYLSSLLHLESDVEVVGKFDNGRDALAGIPRLRPDVILLDAEMPELDGYAVAEQLLADMPGAQIIFLLSDNDAESIRRTMRIGARDYLVKPCSIDELAFSIRRVRGSSQVTPLFAPPPPEPIVTRSTAGHLIAVYSPAGGVGVSTVAVNLALALKKATGARVVLVDSNEQFGDLGLLTKLQSPYSIADLASPGDELDQDLLGQVLQTHSSGVRVLLSPANPEWHGNVTTERLEQIFSVLDSMSDYIICDAGHGASNPTRAILDTAAHIVLVTTDDIAAQKNTKIFLTLAQTLGYEDKILLVLNRQAKKNQAAQSEIELNLGHSLACVLPEDTAVNAVARLTGDPFVQARPKSPLSRAVSALASQCVTSDVAVSAPVPSPANPPGKTSPAPKTRFLSNPWARGTVIALASILIVVVLFGRIPLFQVAEPARADASVAVVKASAIPVGNGAQEGGGIQATVLSMQRRQGSAALQVPAGQEAMLVSMRFSNTRNGGLPLTLKPTDFLLVSSQGDGRAPAFGFLTKAGQTLSAVDLAAGKTYEYDLIWYVPGASTDFWVAWKGSDGTTRLFALSPGH